MGGEGRNTQQNGWDDPDVEKAELLRRQQEAAKKLFKDNPAPATTTRFGFPGEKGVSREK